MNQLDEDRKLVERIDDYGKGLTDFEYELLESCLRRLDAGLELTPKQRACVEEIDEKRVA